MDLIGCAYRRSGIDRFPEPLVAGDNDVGVLTGRIGEDGVHGGHGTKEKEGDQSEGNAYHPELKSSVADDLFGLFLLALRTILNGYIGSQDCHQQQDRGGGNDEFDHQLPDADGLGGGRIENG